MGRRSAVHEFTPKCSLPHGSTYFLSKYFFGTYYPVSEGAMGQKSAQAKGSSLK
jgi:hypothetical protein